MDEKLKALKALLDEIRTTYNTYIGARYVPRFTGLYDVTQSYEALDVVDNGSGTSYIAKKPTPAGTPLTDTDYWFLYGSTNGAIVNLQQQINDMKDGDVPGSLQNQIDDNTSDITALTNNKLDKSDVSIKKNRKIIILGDSYNAATDGTTGLIVDGVGARIAALYPDRAGQIVANWAVGGAGFNVKSGSYTFIEWLDAHYSDISNPNEITDMLVFGGYNEIMSSYSNTISGGNTFCQKVRTYFPNCKVHLAFVGWGTRSDSERQKINHDCIPAYQDIALNNSNATLVANSEFILHSYTLCGTDGVHPTATGYQVLALYLGAYLFNNCPIVVYGYTVSQTFTKDSALTGTTPAEILIDRYNEMTHVHFGAFRLTGDMTFSAGRIKLGTIAHNGLLNGFNISSNNPSLRFYVNPGITYNGNTLYERAYIEIENDNVYLHAHDYGNLTVTLIQIPETYRDVFTNLC